MTSKELRDIRFETVRKGYDPDRVDAIMERAADQIDQLNAEKQKADQKMAVLAEKLETIITRTTTNTRMRDFYDIAILQQLYGSTLDPHVLHDALLATAHKRGTERHLAEAAEVFDEVENSPVMQDLWAAYQKKFSYASDLGWDTVMAAVRQLFARCEGTA